MEKDRDSDSKDKKKDKKEKHKEKKEKKIKQTNNTAEIIELGGKFNSIIIKLLIIVSRIAFACIKRNNFK